MAERAKRKSSILKAPKTNQRAPLQDVNTLSKESKSMQDEDFTSHTAILRRRVSFAGKNFVKEFCAEAEIASVHHALEYEQEWLASTDSSGLVTSDCSSHAHSNTTVSEGYSVSVTRRPISVGRSVTADDDNDPIDEVMREFRSNKSAKPQVKPPTRKNRFSFGEIQVKCVAGEEESISPAKDQSAAKDSRVSQHQQPQHFTDAGENSAKFQVPFQTGHFQAEVRGTHRHYSSPVASELDTMTVSEDVFSSTGINSSFVPGSVPFHSLGNKTVLNDSVPAGTIESGAQISSDVPYLRKHASQDTVTDGEEVHHCEEAVNVEKESPNHLVLCEEKRETRQYLDKQQTSTSKASEFSLHESHASSHSKQTGNELAEPSSPSADHCGDNSEKVDIFINTSEKDRVTCNNQTLLMSTSMEFTHVVPGNIVMNPLQINCVDNMERNEVVFPDPSPKTLPSNVQCETEGNWVSMDKYEQEDLRFNQTQVLNSSMEFTAVLPTNIEVNFDYNHLNNPLVVSESVLTHSKTQILSTTMDFTEALPSNLVVGNNKVCQDLENVKVCGSQDFSSVNGSLLPSPIEMECESEESVSKAGEEVPIANDTQAMCISMELTKPLPSRIDDSSEREQEVAASSPSNFISTHNLMEGSCAPMGEALVANESIEIQVSNSFVNSQDRENSKYQSQPAYKESIAMEQLVARTQTIENTINANAFNTQETKDGTLKLGNESDDDVWGEKVIQSEEPGNLPRDSKVSENMSLTSSLDPFKSKPCLNYSSSEAVMIQSNSRLIMDHNIVECRNNQSTNTACEQDVAVNNFTSPREVDCSLKTDDLGKDRPAQALCFLADKEINPFISKPRLFLTPVKQGVIEPFVQTAEGSRACGLASGMDDRENGMKLRMGNSLAVESDLRHSMLSDVCAPFNDTPSVEILTNVTDSSGNMLHTTIKNAETTLMHLQSPELQDEIEGSGDIEKPMKYKDSEEIRGEGSNLAQTSHSSAWPQESITVPNVSKTLSANCQTNVKSVSEITRSSFKGEKRPRQSSNSEDSDTGTSSASKSSKVDDNKDSKRTHESIVDSEEVCMLQLKAKRMCTPSSKKNAACLAADIAIDSEDELALSHSGLSNDLSSNTNCSSASLCTLSVCQSLDDVIFINQSRYPQYWEARKQEKDLWSFKFKCTELVLKIHLKQSSHIKGEIESFNGQFTSLVTDSTYPILRWGMNIMMERISNEEWRSHLKHSNNFMSTLQKIVHEILPVRKFIIETIAFSGKYNLQFFNNSLSCNILSFKCQFAFRVHLKLDSWERYSPDHIRVENIVGETRVSEVKNLITAVKKDIYFLRNYIQDVKDYVKTLEQLYNPEIS